VLRRVTLAYCASLAVALVLLYSKMTDSPSWLSPDEGGAAPAPAPATESFEISGNNDAAAAGQSSTTAMTQADDADLPGIILMMRLANMGVASALMACSVCCFCSMKGYPFYVATVLIST